MNCLPKRCRSSKRNNLSLVKRRLTKPLIVTVSGDIDTLLLVHIKLISALLPTASGLPIVPRRADQEKCLEGLVQVVRHGRKSLS